MTIVNKMRIYGEEMPDVKVAKKIMHSLTEKFNYIFKGTMVQIHITKEKTFFLLLFLRILIDR